MFDSKASSIKTEPTPQRVFELAKLVSEKSPISEKDARETLEPSSLNEGTSPYFGAIRDVAIELGLIELEDGMLIIKADKPVLKSLDTLREYCNLRVFNDQASAFYKITQCCLDSNDEWFKYKNLSDQNIQTYIMDKTQLSSVFAAVILGFRFWISFLGFGYIHEVTNKIMFLPNMTTALRDFMVNSEYEKRKDYTVAEFFQKLPAGISVATNGLFDKYELNLAMSNALRQLHDEKVIQLKRNLDSKDVWKLFISESHEFRDEITHICVLKGNK